MGAPAPDGEIRVQFAGLTSAEATAVARELEMELLAGGAPSEAVRVARDNDEAMDFGATLLLGASILGWKLLEGGAKGVGTEISKLARREVYEALRRKIDAFCVRRRVAAEVAVPGAGSWFLRSERPLSFDDIADQARRFILETHGAHGVLGPGIKVVRPMPARAAAPSRQSDRACRSPR